MDLKREKHAGGTGKRSSVEIEPAEQMITRSKKKKAKTETEPVEQMITRSKKKKAKMETEPVGQMITRSKKKKAKMETEPVGQMRTRRRKKNKKKAKVETERVEQMRTRRKRRRQKKKANKEEKEIEEEEEEFPIFLKFEGSRSIDNSYHRNHWKSYSRLDPYICGNPLEIVNQAMWNQEDEEDEEAEDLWSSESEKEGEEDEQVNTNIRKGASSSPQSKTWKLAACTSGEEKEGGGDEQVNKNIRKRASPSSESKSWKLAACTSGEEEQTSDIGMPIFTRKLNKEEEKRIWFPSCRSDDDASDDPDFLYAEKLKRIEEFCEHLLRRPDIKDGNIDEKAFLAKLSEESPMPEFLAKFLIKTAITFCFSSHKISQLFKSLKKLLSLEPFITVETDFQSEYFIESCIACGIPEKDISRACHYLEEIFGMEHIFHPFIRKNNLKDIVAFNEIVAKIIRRGGLQKMKDCRLFSLAVIRKVVSEQVSHEAYQAAFEIVQLHQEFDRHLALLPRDLVNGKGKIKELMRDDNVVLTKFKTLDQSLIKASLRTRIRYLKKTDEYRRYYFWLKPFVELKTDTGYSRLDDVLEEIRQVHPDFPKLSQECNRHENSDEFSSFGELLSKIKRSTECPVSVTLLLQGILWYMDICSDIQERKKMKESWDPKARYRENRGEFANAGEPWDPTVPFHEFTSSSISQFHIYEKIWAYRHYEHPAYTTYFDLKF